MARDSDNPFETGLDRTPANYVPLSPLSFLRRAAHVFPGHPSLIHGALRHTWGETYTRCRRLASALAARGVGPGDTVSVMAPNIPAIYEASFAVPMLGAVLNTLNVRLDGGAIAFMLEHGEAKALITDTEFAPVIRDALARLGRDLLVVDVADPEVASGERLGEVEYEDFLAGGDPAGTEGGAAVDGAVRQGEQRRAGRRSGAQGTSTPRSTW